MRLKNDIDYKRFPEPSRGDWTRFTILVLSALCNQQKVPHECAAFFVWGRAGESLLSNRFGPERKEASGLTALLIAPGDPEKCEGAQRLSKSRPDSLKCLAERSARDFS